MSKRAKLKDLKQIDGKAEPSSPMTLDQIWGERGLTKYGTNNVEEYKEYLRNLNRTDMHAHAIQVGILPNDNLEILVARLEREFMRHVSSFSAPTEKPKREKKASKEIQKILSEGR